MINRRMKEECINGSENVRKSSPLSGSCHRLPSKTMKKQKGWYLVLLALFKVGNCVVSIFRKLDSLDCAAGFLAFTTEKQVQNSLSFRVKKVNSRESPNHGTRSLYIRHVLRHHKSYVL